MVGVSGGMCSMSGVLTGAICGRDWIIMMLPLCWQMNTECGQTKQAVMIFLRSGNTLPRSEEILDETEHWGYIGQ